MSTIYLMRIQWRGVDNDLAILVRTFGNVIGVVINHTIYLYTIDNMFKYI